ncbi:MAG: hypothetical protein K1X35_05325 [Caulobacteraceae bacterium]|nr:hypothetical protein [Caulobacteraceae bacterium]
MDSWKSKFLTAAAVAALAFVASCDNGPSAVETRPRGAADAGFEEAGWEGGARQSDAFSGGREEARDIGREARGERASGGDAGLWTSNRKYSARQNAEYHFRRDGRDFGARNTEDYVRMAHAFIEHPPRGTLSLKRRNGDQLFYDPAGNTFVVADRKGAPRTMFKPRDGMAYWEKQKQREGSSRSREGED